MATRQDVANAAGVSTAVVSYVVNNGPRPVAPDTKARVLDAIERLGYRPNGVARALATRRTHALALIVPDVTNSYFAQLCQLVESAAFERGYTLLLGNTRDDGNLERANMETFADRGVDGLILVPAAQPGGTRPTEPGIPTVVVDRPAGFEATTILVDNRAGGRLATEHLLSHGHRHIACLGGPSELATAVDRRAGWAEALALAGIAADESWSVESDFTRSGAYTAMLRVLAGSEPPTAVFATADAQVSGIYRAAADAGLSIPGDLAVTSFDSTDDARYLVPRITAVRQPVEEIAARAVAAVLDAVTYPGAPASRMVLPVELTLGGSCGCPDLPITHQEKKGAAA